MKKQTGECTPKFEVFLLLLVFVTLVGAFYAESDIERDCSKLGKVVLNGKSFVCAEVVK